MKPCLDFKQCIVEFSPVPACIVLNQSVSHLKVLVSAQEGSTNSAAPWSGSNEIASLWTNISPAGLSSTVEQLVTIIYPYVNERLVSSRLM